MSIVRFERTKLLANALDRASTSCFTVGIATPLAALLYDIGNFSTTLTVDRIAAGLGGWLLAAITLHLLGRFILRDLER